MVEIGEASPKGHMEKDSKTPEGFGQKTPPIHSGNKHNQSLEELTPGLKLMLGTSHLSSDLDGDS